MCFNKDNPDFCLRHKNTKVKNGVCHVCVFKNIPCDVDFTLMNKFKDFIGGDNIDETMLHYKNRESEEDFELRKLLSPDLKRNIIFNPIRNAMVEEMIKEMKSFNATYIYYQKHKIGIVHTNVMAKIYNNLRRPQTKN